MRYIGNGFWGVAVSLFMFGCMADDATPTSGDDDGESAAADDGSVLGDAKATPFGTGVFTTVTDCGASAWKSPATGTSHAGIQNCSITWGKDISVSPTEFFQSVSFQLRDEQTDGVCARATVTAVSGSFSECNGVWVTKSASLNGHHSSITVTLSWGGNQPVSKTRNAPSGF